MSGTEGVGRDQNELDRFRFLASFLAGRTVAIAAAAPGAAAYTDGSTIFVSIERPADWQRREVVVQAALLGAGSLDAESVRGLRGRPALARRYLSVEGQRVLVGLVDRVPAAAVLVRPGIPATMDPASSLAVASARGTLADPPAEFGSLRPSSLAGAARLRKQVAEASRPASTVPAPRAADAADAADAEDDEVVASKAKSDKVSAFKKENTLSSKLVKALSTRRSKRGDGGGGSGDVAVRRVSALAADARPVPVPVRFAEDDLPPGLAGAEGAVYPEWDVRNGCYRPEWCVVSDFVLEPRPAATPAPARDEELRRRLSRMGLGPTRCRRRPDGDDLDIDALVDAATGLRAGYSTTEDVYVERRHTARNLGVLILVDASGSGGELDPEGHSVHERQRHTAATLAMTLEELGDRVAVYGFRSHGRTAVHLIAVKRFTERFGDGCRANLAQLESVGYTRLGAAIRHAGELLKKDAGTPFRLLLLLSDGLPFDAGYRDAYAEADVRKALEELRRDGVACLCLAIGSSTPSDDLGRVFGSASHAHAPSLPDLSPRMDELFLGALRELSVST